MQLDSYRPAEAGFTLLEMIVVVTIMGLSLSFVAPRLTTWLDRLRSGSERQQFEDSLASLASDARRAGHTIFLRSVGPGIEKSKDDAPIDLPRGWELQVEPPIAFRYDGLCTGGTVRLMFPAGEASYRLAAPYCRLQQL